MPLPRALRPLGHGPDDAVPVDRSESWNEPTPFEVTSPSWHSRAKCTGDMGDLFFDQATFPEAQGVCHACPVRSECLSFALAERIEHGVWGGLTPQQRKRLLGGKW